jgi:endonuclease VIII
MSPSRGAGLVGAARCGTLLGSDVPEGDTIRRTADVLRCALLGDEVVAASGRAGGVQLARVVGSRVGAITTHGKHLFIGFEVGLTLHTHLGMKGSWHRYGPHERWRRGPDRAVAVIETERTVVVCFDAPVVELLDSRALESHPALVRLGPDLLAEPPQIREAAARARSPDRLDMAVAEVLLEQGVAAGLGNVYRSEILFIERIDPFTPVGSLDAAIVEGLLRTGARLLRANLGGGGRVTMPDASGVQPGAGIGAPRAGRLWVYRRTARPCRRCGTLIRSTSLGQPPRRLYWCPGCQPRQPG